MLDDVAASCPFSDKSTFFQLQNLRRYPRRPCGSFWYHLELQGPTFDQFHLNFQFLFSLCLTLKVCKSNILPLFLEEHALKPCPDCRSRNSAQIQQIESAPNPNLTDLVKKQGCNFHLFTTIQLVPFILKITGPETMHDEDSAKKTRALHDQI